MKVMRLEEQDFPTYENFVKNHRGDLYQSLLWGRFQEKLTLKRHHWAMKAIEGSEWLGTALVMRHALPMGYCWLSLARGPVLTVEKREEEVWQAFLKEIHPIAQKEKALFLRVELPEKSPLILNPPLWEKAHAHYHPEWTLKIDLGLLEEELLKQMKPKGRYNIRVAQKQVTVRKTHASQDVHDFYEILKQTGNRDGFNIHEESYYQTMLQAASQDDWGTLFVAEHEGKIIGGIIVTFYGDTATYYYGASDYQYRPLMAPYLLQWTAMCEAKKQGVKWYDLLGIAPPDEPSHSWRGITQFKEKFGGTTIKYPPAVELVFKPILYHLMQFIKRIRG